MNDKQHAYKPKKSWYKRIWVWILIIVVVLIIAGALSGNKAPTTTTQSTSGAPKTEKTVFKPGDVIDFDNKKVTVASPERNWNSGNEFIVPQSGNEFVRCR